MEKSGALGSPSIRFAAAAECCYVPSRRWKPQPLSHDRLGQPKPIRRELSPAQPPTFQNP
jgi:hypothetical protein